MRSGASAADGIGGRRYWVEVGKVGRLVDWVGGWMRDVCVCGMCDGWLIREDWDWDWWIYLSGVWKERGGGGGKNVLAETGAGILETGGAFPRGGGGGGKGGWGWGVGGLFFWGGGGGGGGGERITLMQKQRLAFWKPGVPSHDDGDGVLYRIRIRWPNPMLVIT